MQIIKCLGMHSHESVQATGLREGLYVGKPVNKAKYITIRLAHESRLACDHTNRMPENFSSYDFQSGNHGDAYYKE